VRALSGVFLRAAAVACCMEGGSRDPEQVTVLCRSAWVQEFRDVICRGPGNLRLTLPSRSNADAPFSVSAMRTEARPGRGRAAERRSFDLAIPGWSPPWNGFHPARPGAL